jgi:hypothetical protein
MSDDAKVALTREEWLQIEQARFGDYTKAIPAYGVVQSDFLYGGRRHALAALALHGTGLGFSRLDVVFLRSIEGTEEVERYAQALAARIEALIPPEWTWPAP